MPQTNDDALLAHAITIAAAAHKKQYDKNGAPYILHPLRMLQQAITKDLPRSVQIVAVLHDIVEDTEWTHETLAAEGFGADVLEALTLVTKQPDEEDKKGEDTGYQKFVDRICAASGPSGSIARHVKLLDLEDNMNVLRYDDVTEKVCKRLQKYMKARKQVLAATAKHAIL